MNNLYDVLEICLQELENGASLETVLTPYPDLASELRPILEASMMARTMSVPAPEPEVARRGRAKLLQHAAEMREAKAIPRKRMIPLFQRLAISFSLTAVFLASGTGLVGASSTALPGEHLYPVKRTWEDVRLFFVFDQQAHNALKNEFENERLQEVSNLLVEGRDETIQFAGVFTQVNGVKYISGVAVLVPANLQLPADGAAVTVTGKTNAQGFVEIESIDLLPDGAVVPVGKPVEADDVTGSNSGSGSVPENGEGSGSGNEAQGGNVNEAPTKSDPQSFEIKGNVKSTSNNLLVIDGQTIHLENAKINGTLKAGANVEIKGFYAADGSFNATEVKVNESKLGGSGNNENQGSGSSSGSNSNDNGGSKPKDSGSANGGDHNSSSGGSNSSDGGSGGGDGGGGGGDG